MCKMDKVHFYKQVAIFLTICLLNLNPVTAYVKDSELLDSSGSRSFTFGDDGHTSIDLERTFKFLGTTYSTVFINGNGLMTFINGSGSYGYGCNTNATTLPTISVYVADAKQRQASRLLHRQDRSQTFLDKVSKDVFIAFPSLKNRITLNWMLIVTWINIESFRDALSAHLNTFQSVLTTDGMHSFVLFYYNNITWPTTTLGGRAEAGIYGGRSNLENSYLIPNSCNTSLINIPGMSNIDIPGKFVFRVDSTLELPSVSVCIPQIKQSPVQPLRLTPAIVRNVGRVPVLVEDLNLCLNYNVTNVACIFRDDPFHATSVVTINGSVIPGQLTVICPTPESFPLGMAHLTVSLQFSNSETFSAYGFLYFEKLVRNDIQLNAELNKMGKLVMNGSWDPISSVRMANIVQFFKTNVNRDFPKLASSVNLTVQEELGDGLWRELCSFRNISNSGYWTSDDDQGIGLPSFVQSAILSEKLETMPMSLKMSRSVEMENGNGLSTEQFSDIITTTFVLAKLKAVSSANIYDKKCKQWHDHEPSPPMEGVIPCPVNLQQALADWRFSLDGGMTFSAKQIMNPLNHTVFIQSVPSLSGTGSQCSYDNRGDLVIGYPYGSRLHRRSPNNRKDNWNHYWDDTIPYMQCCLLSNAKEENCKKYFFAKRLPFDGSGYKSPVPFRVIGATHIYTLDGSVYLMNGLGTFWMLKYPNHLEMQVLLEKYSGSSIKNATTVVTTAVMKSYNGNGTSAKFQVLANVTCGLLIWLDNEPVNFYHDKRSGKYIPLQENFTLYHDGVTVLINETSQALFSFSSGVSIKFMLSAGNTSLNMIGSVGQGASEKVSGLLGNFDGNHENDLVITNGTIVTGNSTGDLYRDFEEQWRVLQNESLFLFPPGKTYSSYNNYSDFQSYQFTHDSIVKMMAASAATFCENVEDCQIDYHLTDSEQFGKSSLSAYRQFQNLLSASKVISKVRECASPPNLSNGGYHENGFSLGSLIQPYCENGYDLHIQNKINGVLLETINFTCVPDTINMAVNVTSTNSKISSWMSTEISSNPQPLSAYSIDCLSAETKERKASRDNKLKVDPTFVSIIGSIPLNLTIAHGLAMKHLIGVTCNYHSEVPSSSFKTVGAVVEVAADASATNVTCPLPILQTLGKMNIKLVIKYLDKPALFFEGHFWVHKIEDDTNLIKISRDRDNNNFILSWNPLNAAVQNQMNKSCQLGFALVQKNGKLEELEPVWDANCNSGKYQGSFENLTSLKNLRLNEIFTTTAILVLKQTQGNNSRIISTSDPLSSILTLHDVIITNRQSQQRETNQSGIDFDLLCKQWYDQEKNYHSSTADTLSCPRSAAQAEVDWRFTLDKQNSWKDLQPGAAAVFVQSVDSSLSKNGPVCAYNDRGSLLFGSPAGSRIQRYSPFAWDGYWKHYTHDVLPYLYCCRWSANSESSCQNYFYEKRGMPWNGNYTSPKFAHVWGAGHIQTFDGTRYRFSGAGEFWMIQHESRRGSWNNQNDKFLCQARLEPYFKTNQTLGESSKTANLSVVTAMVLQQEVNGNKVTVQVSRNMTSRGGYGVVVEGDLVEWQQLKMMHYDGLTLFFNRTNASPFQILVVFQNGFSVSFNTVYTEEGESGMNVIFTTNGQLGNEILGLLGDFDGDEGNDFRTLSSPNNASSGWINYEIGKQWLVPENQSIFSHESSYTQFQHATGQPVELVSISSDASKLPPVPKNFEFCKNSTECDFDFVTTGSDFFALVCMANCEYFQHLVTASKTTVQECTLSPGDAASGHLMNGSLDEGSVFQMTCGDNGVDRQQASFVCTELENSTLRWISTEDDDVNEISLSCRSAKSESMIKDHANVASSPVTLILIGTVVFLVISLIVLLYYVFVQRNRMSEMDDPRIVYATERDMVELENLVKYS